MVHTVKLEKKKEYCRVFFLFGSGGNKTCEPRENQFMGIWLNKLWFIHTMGGYQASRKSELGPQQVVWAVPLRYLEYKGVSNMILYL